MDTPQRAREFIRKWRGVELKESAFAQEHFIDLCHLVQHPTPAEADKTGASFTFEKGVEKTGGGYGFADVWKRAFFGWEYKGPHKDLEVAYNQLLRYYEHLEQPPLLVVSDHERFEIHTRFNNAVPKTYSFTLEQLEQPSTFGLLEAVFHDPQRLHPNEQPDKLTQKAADRFAQLAASLRERYAPRMVAHFLTQVVFTLFAEDIRLLPRGASGERIFTEAVRRNQNERYMHFPAYVRQLFATMATGGDLGYEQIAHFNGGLFEAGAEVWVPDLTVKELESLLGAAELDWSAIEPSIFGTLFERGLDPAKRSQLGAHYTSREDIVAIVEPVLMAPLRREWERIKDGLTANSAVSMNDRLSEARAQPAAPLQAIRDGFLEKLASVRVLDPACGSGNFLYVSLNLLKDLEKEVINHEAFVLLPSAEPRVSPAQLYGIEISEYAHELASVVVWIGYIQWHRNNGYTYRQKPILQKLSNIENKDAILGTDPDGSLPEDWQRQADWPEVDVIVGNPPFLGIRKMRAALGDDYVTALFDLYEGGPPSNTADFVTYWFAKAQQQIRQGKAKRAGLLATQGIRGKDSRAILQSILRTGDIFFAESDREWVLDGATVRVSMVGFDDGSEKIKILDGNEVEAINSNLTAGVDVTRAKPLRENFNVAFMADTKGGAFDIPNEIAQKMLSAPLNPNGRPNSDVIKRWVNGLDITRRPRNYWIIDFGTDMPLEEAAFYEQPFEYIKHHVKPERDQNRRAAYRDRWWIHVEPRPAMRSALGGLSRYLVTIAVAKHRIFVWLKSEVLADHSLIAFARDDDYFMGVLHSKAHELWALEQGSQLESRPRYTSTTTFETFPLPYTPGTEPTDDPKYIAVAEAARELNELRERWVNPEKTPNMEESRWQKLLKERTLTKLYNERPMWLQLAHEKLDKAVFAAYGWEYPLEDEEILRRLLALNLERAAAE